MNREIVIKRTAKNFIYCYIKDENGKEYSIGFNNDVRLFFNAIENYSYNDESLYNSMFNVFHKILFHFNENMRQRAHICDIFSIKYFYKLMWSKLYEMLCVSSKYYDTINLKFVLPKYIFEHDLSFYIISFLEKYFNIILDLKTKTWIKSYCDVTFEGTNMERQMSYGIDYGKEEKGIKYKFFHNNSFTLPFNLSRSTIISEIKLSKDKNKDICYMVVIWNDKTITKVTLPIKPKNILSSFKTGNNFNLIDTTFGKLLKNSYLKDIWNDNKKIKFLFNSFLICYLKQKYPKTKINSLLECIGYNAVSGSMAINDKLLNLLSIIVKMNDDAYYKIMYKTFFN